MIKNANTKKFTVLKALFFGVVISACAQNVGVGTNTPQSKVDISGNLTVGSGTHYAGVTKAPANGAIIQGPVGIGNNAPNAATILDMSNTSGL